MSYPYTQREHDDAVGVGCLLLAVALSPLAVVGLSLVAGAVVAAISALMVAIQ